MLKLAFEYLTDSYSLLDNPLNNYMIMVVVGMIAYMIAYNIVGWFYRTDLIDGREAGHVLHWVIRLFVFVAIYYACATVIRIYYRVISVPTYIWWIVAAVIATGVILIAMLRWMRQRNRTVKLADDSDEQNQ